MKKISFFLKNLVLASLFMLITSFIADAQTQGSLSVERTIDGKFHVYFKASASGSFQILPDAVITILAPSGAWQPSNIVTVNSPGNGWGVGNTKYTTGGNDYISFVPANLPSGSTSYVANTSVELFNFDLGGDCASGSINIYTGSELFNGGVSYVTSFVVQDTPTSVAREGWDGTSFNNNSAACTVVPSLSCTGITLSPNTFTVGTAGNANLTVNLSGIAAGSYTFSETTAANFAIISPTSFNLTSGQPSVQIPISYDGLGTAGTQTLTIGISNNGASTQTCTVTATINTAICAANAGSLN